MGCPKFPDNPEDTAAREAAESLALFLLFLLGLAFLFVTALMPVGAFCLYYTYPIFQERGGDFCISLSTMFLMIMFGMGGAWLMGVFRH